MDLGDARTDGLKLSLKLYHARELQLNYEQLMTQAPTQRQGFSWHKSAISLQEPNLQG